METPEPLWAIYASSWSPSQLKSVSSCSGGLVLYLTLWSLALVLSLGSSEEKLPWLSFSALQVLILTPLSLIFSRLTVLALSHKGALTQRMLWVPSLSFGPLLDSVQYVCESFVLGSLKLDMELPQMWPYQGWVEGKDYVPWHSNVAPKAVQNTLEPACLAWHIQVCLCLELNVDVWH